MDNAQDKLSKIFTIDIDGGIIIDNEFDYLTEFNIPCWNNDIFSQININFDTESSNYFIFFNFANIHSEASSRIVFCDDRPSGGVITFNPEKIKSKISIDYLTSLMIHHLIHLLGFHLYNENSLGDEIFDGNIKEVDGKYYVKIENNPILYEYIRTYFNCPDFSDDIELKKDEDNNIHWPKRLFLGDIMTQFDYPEEQVLSGFTLAFLEDYSYINVIKSYTGGLMRFGKHKGCKFLTEKCGDNIENEEYQKTFANEFYLPANIENLPDYFMPSCSSGRLSKTVHKLYEITGPKADYHEFYSNNIVGKESANYCPISEYDDSSRTNTYIGLCSKESTGIDSTLENKLGETFSSKSFCVISSLIQEQFESDSKIRSVCYEMECSSLSLSIKIGSYYIVCPKEGGKVVAENFVGYLLCPDYNLICTGKKMCNSMLDCIDNESEEKENTFDYNGYNGTIGILTSQNYEVYSVQEINYGYELAKDGICPQFCAQCNSNKICIKCRFNYSIAENGRKCVEFGSNSEKIVNDDDDGLSTGAIIGIVFGCVGFILAIVAIIFLVKHFLKPKDIKTDNEIINKEKNEKEEKESRNSQTEVNKVEIYTTQRITDNIN